MQSRVASNKHFEISADLEKSIHVHDRTHCTHAGTAGGQFGSTISFGDYSYDPRTKRTLTDAVVGAYGESKTALYTLPLLDSFIVLVAEYVP